jgi:hypothetical protein
MARGLVDANLGNGLFKKRIGRFGAGKSRGYRVLVAKRTDGPWFFIEGFAKNAMNNIDADALQVSKATARELNGMSTAMLFDATERGQLKEVKCDAETKE